MNKIPLSLSEHGRRRPSSKHAYILNPATLNTGLLIIGSKGSGKSRLGGRLIAFLFFLRGIAQVIIDPLGGLIDNFLDKLKDLPPELQRQLESRILYVDMSGKHGYVCPFPLYYRLDERDSLDIIAGRVLQVFRRLDPYLETAPIQGWNAVREIGIYAGMVLAALGCQITEMEELLYYPESWVKPMKAALVEYPELWPAVRYFTQRYIPERGLRNQRAGALLSRVSMFSLDSSMRAMFGANKPGIEWQAVENNRMTVLLDFRHELDKERSRFKMMWTFWYFMEYIKWRGRGRHQPIALMIDELTTLTNIR